MDCVMRQIPASINTTPRPAQRIRSRTVSVASTAQRMTPIPATVRIRWNEFRIVRMPGVMAEPVPRRPVTDMQRKTAQSCGFLTSLRASRRPLGTRIGEQVSRDACNIFRHAEGLPMGLRITLEPHPKLRAAAFATSFPQPLGVSATPALISALLQADAPAPVQRDE